MASCFESKFCPKKSWRRELDLEPNREWCASNFCDFAAIKFGGKRVVIVLSLVYDGEVIDAKSLDKWRNESRRGRELLGVENMERGAGDLLVSWRAVLIKLGPATRTFLPSEPALYTCT